MIFQEKIDIPYNHYSIVSVYSGMKHFKSLLLILTFIFAFSCEQDDTVVSTACGVNDPAENLPWLKTMIESWKVNSTIYEYMYVQQGTNSGQTVFIVGNCCPFCDTYFPIYNCAGEEIISASILDIKDKKTIWKPEGSLCTF